MAALSSNTANVIILEDTTQIVSARLFLHQASTGDESSVLKINASALNYRTLLLQMSGITPYWVGEKLVGNTSGAVGYVVDNPGGSNVVTITVESGTFQAAEPLRSEIQKVNTFTISTITTPAYRLDLQSVWFSISGTAKVGVEFANGSAFGTALLLAGTGYYGRNELQAKLPANSIIPSANGNLYISTYGVANLGGYSLTIELKKSSGYAGRPQY